MTPFLPSFLAAYKFSSALLTNSDNLSFAFGNDGSKTLDKVRTAFHCTPDKFRDLIHALYNP